jgi:hypothetical protein
MSDWQHGVDWFLAEYYRCRLRLDLRWCKLRADAKGLIFAGPSRSGETSRLSSMDLVWTGSSAGRVVARKARRNRGHEPVQGSGSQPESARGVCGGSPQNCWVTWLSHKTKTGGSTGGDEIWARRGCQGTRRTDRRTCIGRTQTAAKAWPPDEDIKSWPYYPWGVCIFLYAFFSRTPWVKAPDNRIKLRRKHVK